ncbi:MAG TPA: hypothetical protein V6C86_24165 [Oculatellaceae cyanobacterium]
MEYAWASLIFLSVICIGIVLVGGAALFVGLYLCWHQYQAHLQAPAPQMPAGVYRQTTHADGTVHLEPVQEGDQPPYTEKELEQWMAGMNIQRK